MSRVQVYPRVSHGFSRGYGYEYEIADLSETRTRTRYGNVTSWCNQIWLCELRVHLVLSDFHHHNPRKSGSNTNYSIHSQVYLTWNIKVTSNTTSKLLIMLLQWGYTKRREGEHGASAYKRGCQRANERTNEWTRGPVSKWEGGWACAWRQQQQHGNDGSSSSSSGGDANNNAAITAAAAMAVAAAATATAGDSGDTHTFTLSTESCDNRPFRHLYIEPKRRRPSAMSMMSTLSDVSPINTCVSCPIARGWSLIPHQFRGLVSPISPLKHHFKLISTVQNNWHIDIDTIAMEWWNHQSDVSSGHGLTSISALPVLAI